MAAARSPDPSRRCRRAVQPLASVYPASLARIAQMPPHRPQPSAIARPRRAGPQGRGVMKKPRIPRRQAMPYELYYWPSNQGRGEFVRLALEEAAVDYVDVGRLPEADGGGVPAILKLMNAADLKTPPFAPPFLKAGELIIGQTANILMFIGAHHGLAPADEAGRLWAHQLQLSVTDFVKEIHDTHHPVGAAFYYEDQKAEAKRYTENF